MENQYLVLFFIGRACFGHKHPRQAADVIARLLQVVWLILCETKAMKVMKIFSFLFNFFHEDPLSGKGSRTVDVMMIASLKRAPNIQVTEESPH